MELVSQPAGISPRILVIDRGPHLAEGLGDFLKGRGTVSRASSWAEGSKVLDRTPHDTVLVCLDGPDGGTDALETVKRAAAHRGGCVSVLAVAPDSETGFHHEALRSGADGLILRSYRFPDMERIISRSVRRSRALRLIDARRRSSRLALPDPVFGSPAMRRVLEQAARVMDSGESILIEGEPGTGRKSLSRWIHHESNRRDAAFEIVDVSAAAPARVELGLFGREEGPGADAGMPGVLEIADGGTVVLTGAAGIDTALESRIIDLLDKKPFTRVGGHSPVSVDVRYICISDKSGAVHGPSSADAGKRVRGHFGTRVIKMPPLRDRKPDIPEIAANILNDLGFEDGGRETAALDPALMARMQQQDWPGNITELVSFIKREICGLDDRRIKPPDGASGDKGQQQREGFAGPGWLEAGYDEAVRMARRELVSRALERAGGKVSEAARILGKRREVIYHICKDLDIDLSVFRKKRRRSRSGARTS